MGLPETVVSEVRRIKKTNLTAISLIIMKRPFDVRVKSVRVKIYSQLSKIRREKLLSLVCIEPVT